VSDPIDLEGPEGRQLVQDLTVLVAQFQLSLADWHRRQDRRLRRVAAEVPAVPAPRQAPPAPVAPPADPPPVRDLYPIEEVAIRLSVSARHVWQLVEDGHLRSVKLGRRRLVPAAALEEYVRGLG
jgi:excisionase family DNA binding protein